MNQAENRLFPITSLTQRFQGGIGSVEPACWNFANIETGENFLKFTVHHDQTFNCFHQVFQSTFYNFSKSVVPVVICLLGYNFSNVIFYF